MCKQFVLIFLTVVLLATPANAGWGGNDCGPVGPMVSQPSVVEPPPYRWQSTPEARQIAYMQWGQQLGNYDLDKREYYALLPDGSWSGPCSPPAQLPANLCKCTHGCTCDPLDCKCSNHEQSPPGLPPDGVDQKKVEAGKHYHNGQECSRQHLIAALQKASVPSDSHKLRLTLIGAAEVTGAILAELEGNPEISEFLVQQYTADHWAVAQAGFVTDGKPVVVYLQSPDGTVLHRQSDYEGGAPVLAEALREAASSYDPTTDPDLRKKDIITVVRKYLSGLPSEAWLIGAAVLAFLYFRKVK